MADNIVVWVVNWAVNTWGIDLGGHRASIESLDTGHWVVTFSIGACWPIVAHVLTNWDNVPVQAWIEPLNSHM